MTENAFTDSQLDTVHLLTDQLGRSYAMPYNELYFPFIVMEFKSQAKGGTHYVAANQAAAAGAIISNGVVELTRRGGSVGLDSLDYNEPQLFSLSMDDSNVCIYVHWLAMKSGQFSFHVERLSQHDLRDLDGLRAIQRIVKNILDWGQNERLIMICKQLDSYREKSKLRGQQRRGRQWRRLQRRR